MDIQSGIQVTGYLLIPLGIMAFLWTLDIYCI